MTAAAASASAGAVPSASLPDASGARATASRLSTRASAAMGTRWGSFALIALAITFPMLDTALGLDMMNPMLRILTSVMLAIGLNVVVGFAGLLDLGYVAFWAIGAYVVGWFASGQFATVHFSLGSGLPSSMPGIHVSIWLLFVVAACVTALFGVLLGAPTLRLRGDYLAIVTLGFGEIVPKLFQNGDDIGGHNLTNGTRGISGLDAPSLGGPAVDHVLGLGWGSWGPLNLLPWYYLGILLVALCWYVSATMQWSKLGRAWMAIREDETAASAMGIDLVRTKLWAYGIGAALGGMAGVYHGARIGSIFPASFQFYISISVLCMVIIGGMGNIAGAVLGAFCIEGLNFWLLPSLSGWAHSAGVNVDLTSWNLLIFGVLLVVMMLYRPQGFLPAKARVIQFEDDDDGSDVVRHRPGGTRLVDEAHTVDPAHAGHADHYPSALRGPSDGAHVELDAGTHGHAHVAAAEAAPVTDVHVSRYEGADAAGAPGAGHFPRPTSQLGAPTTHGEGVPRPRRSPIEIPADAQPLDAYRPGIVRRPDRPATQWAADGAPMPPPQPQPHGAPAGDALAQTGTDPAPAVPPAGATPAQQPTEPTQPRTPRGPFSFSKWEGSAWRTS